MQLVFDTIDELREFVKTHLKNPRNKAGNDDADTTLNTAGATGGAPAPLMPPQNPAPQFQPSPAPAFNPNGAPQGGFPGVGVQIDPAVAALVNRVNAKIDGSVAAGQPIESVLAWFRNRCGPEAANATLDQIKQHFLPKHSIPSLEEIAKLMNA